MKIDFGWVFGLFSWGRIFRWVDFLKNMGRMKKCSCRLGIYTIPVIWWCWVFPIIVVYSGSLLHLQSPQQRANNDAKVRFIGVINITYRFLLWHLYTPWQQRGYNMHWYWIETYGFQGISVWWFYSTQFNMDISISIRLNTSTHSNSGDWI